MSSNKFLRKKVISEAKISFDILSYRENQKQISYRYRIEWEKNVSLKGDYDGGVGNADNDDDKDDLQNDEGIFDNDDDNGDLQNDEEIFDNDDDKDDLQNDEEICLHPGQNDS